MIVGNGMLAKAFCHYEKDEKVLIFASGVSNSSETDNARFAREHTLLKNSVQANQDKLFVYFSTCSIADSDLNQTPYVLHKLKMENIISCSHDRFLIFRLPQLVGKTNNDSTLVNFLHARIRDEKHFYIWEKASRHIIDVMDVSAIVSHIIDRKLYKNSTINVASRPFSVIQIVNILEDIVGKRGNYSSVEKGTAYKIECPEMSSIVKELNIQFGDGYLNQVLKKYFADEDMPLKLKK